MTDITEQLAEALEDILDTGFTRGPQGKRAKAALAAYRAKQSESEHNIPHREQTFNHLHLVV